MKCHDLLDKVPNFTGLDALVIEMGQQKYEKSCSLLVLLKLQDDKVFCQDKYLCTSRVGSKELCLSCW